MQLKFEEDRARARAFVVTVQLQFQFPFSVAVSVFSLRFQLQFRFPRYIMRSALQFDVRHTRTVSILQLHEVTGWKLKGKPAIERIGD